VVAEEINAPAPPPITAPHSSHNHHCRNIANRFALSIIRS
jgi:hypothetical protein